MTASTEMIESWVASQDDGAATTLSARYLGENVAMLNADQVADVVNGVWREFCEAQGGAGATGSRWSFVSGGTAKTILTRDGHQIGVQRFCGGWPVSNEKTTALLAEIYEATPSDQRP